MKQILVLSVVVMLAAAPAHAGNVFGSPAELITMNGPGMGAFMNTPSRGTRVTTTPNPQPSPAPCPVPNQVWVPAHFTIVYQQVWIAPHYVDRWVPPVYQHQLIRGQAIYVMVQAGYYQRVLAPGYYDLVPVQIWVPGQWVCR
jgi:hypothetical protein